MTWSLVFNRPLLHNVPTKLPTDISVDIWGLERPTLDSDLPQRPVPHPPLDPRKPWVGRSPPSQCGDAPAYPGDPSSDGVWGAGVQKLWLGSQSQVSRVLRPSDAHSSCGRSGQRPNIPQLVFRDGLDRYTIRILDVPISSPVRPILCTPIPPFSFPVSRSQ